MCIYLIKQLPHLKVEHACINVYDFCMSQVKRAKLKLVQQQNCSCALHWLLLGPTSLWLTYRMEAGVLVKAECSRGEQDSQPGIPLCSMPAPGPVLIQHIMSKLLLAAAPIETLIKAIRGSSWGGGWRLRGCCEQGLHWHWWMRERWP